MKKFALVLAAVFGLIVAAPLMAKPAEAAPALTGAGAVAAEKLVPGQVELAQYYYRRRYYRPHRVYRRPYYRNYGYYRGPRVVCRVRYTYYGPRRVCTRRW